MNETIATPKSVLDYCKARNWTDPQFANGSWWAFPPGAVMPVQIATPKPSLSPSDVTLLRKQSDKTLAKWWGALNDYRWPRGLPNPEPFDDLDYGYDPYSRPALIMVWIESTIGMRQILRRLNTHMDSEYFNAFWAGPRGDPEAYEIYREKQREASDKKRERHELLERLRVARLYFAVISWWGLVTATEDRAVLIYCKALFFNLNGN